MQTFDVIVLILPPEAPFPGERVVDHDQHERGADEADEPFEEAYANVRRPVGGGGYLSHRERCGQTKLSEIMGGRLVRALRSARASPSGSYILCPSMTGRESLRVLRERRVRRGGMSGDQSIHFVVSTDKHDYHMAFRGTS